MKLRTALIAALGLSVVPTAALAENLIKRPGAHTLYDIELEPHLLFDFPEGVGLGARGTFVVTQTGFIRRLNDSVGVSIGADVSVSEDTSVIVPVGMQWNFWFTREWSAFGEPGVALRLSRRNRLMPHIGAGGRYQFNSDVALTLRAGWPVSSVGVSFFL